MVAVISEDRLEFPACPFCGSDRREIRYAGFGEFKVVRCSACGVHYLYPRLTETAMQAAYRSGDYFAGGECGYADTSYAAQERALRATFQRLMRNLQKHQLTGGDLLEIGCGYGYLLEEARGFFRSRTGIEMSHEAAAIASRKADHVYEGGLEQLPPGEKFDCIIATHVIEHVYDPLKFLGDVAGHARPNGKIVLATPDMNSILRKVMGRRWPSFKIPEHILYFDAGTLSALMEKAGLRNVHTFPYPHAFPLALIASKLHLPLPKAFANVNVWVPTTTVAAYGSIVSRTT
jgi:SAM-dependent methyltransferase